MNPYENHPSFCEDSDGLCEVKAERDRLRARVEELEGILDGIGAICRRPEGDPIPIAGWVAGHIAELETEIHEGCTPADARVLRKANHALAEERDRLRAALSEMSDELSHYPEGDGIFGHLKRILRRAILGPEGAIKGQGTKITSRLVIQRRFQGGLPWTQHSLPENDMEHAKRCLAEHQEWENTHSTFPGKLRLIRETIEVIEA